MKSIHQVSGILAEYLVREQENKGTSQRVLAYGLEVTINLIVEVVALFLLAYLLGILQFTLMVTLWSSGFRLISGGAHCTAFWRCMLMTQFIFLLLGYLSGILAASASTDFLKFLWLVLTVGMIFITWKWVPGDTSNKPITKPEAVRKFKVLSWVFLALSTTVIFAVGLVNSGTINGKENMLLATAISGIGWQCFTVTPWGYRLINEVDRLLARGIKIRSERRGACGKTL